MCHFLTFVLSVFILFYSCYFMLDELFMYSTLLMFSLIRTEAFSIL